MAFKHRLAVLENTTVRPYRYQNGGDYNEEQQPKEHLINRGTKCFGAKG